MATVERKNQRRTIVRLLTQLHPESRDISEMSGRVEPWCKCVGSRRRAIKRARACCGRWAPTRRVIRHVKNKTLIAIATQHTDTYGDNRSPIRAAFQNRPNTLLGSHTHVSAAQHGQREGRARQREHPNVRGEQAQGTG